MRRVILTFFIVFVFAAACFAQTGVKKKRPLPYEYGRVVINNYSEKAGVAPVVFDHWLHRSKFTCRLCHVDIGFAMKAGGTDIKAIDNVNGYYCGACHNGKSVFGGKEMSAACSVRSITREDSNSCAVCHSLGRNVIKDYDFNKYTSGLPRGRFGNGVDWEKAEEDGLIKPVDFIEGISIKRQSLTIPKDFSLSPKLEDMPDIIFSHKKHTIWNGCEVCHPEIFIGVKKGTTKYLMSEIFDGRYCGVCHGTVAFPLLDCQRCHAKPV